MRLSELLRSGELAPAELKITGITADSREVRPGMLFAALAGTHVDGARFVGDAVARGAVAILTGVETVVPSRISVPVIRDAEPRARLARMAAIFHAPQPDTVVAVTGTNGKTSVASFAEQVWVDNGLSAASIGTLGVSRLEIGLETSLTSPDPVTLHAALSALAGAGVTHVALEASSHGLAQHRLDGVRVAAGAFTNISRDHLDYHPTFEHYLEAKLRLFRELVVPGGRAVVNIDGAGADAACAAARQRGLDLVTIGRGGADIGITVLEPAEHGLAVGLDVRGKRRRLTVPLIGAFQAENALVAAALAAADRSIDLEDALASLEKLKGARGRLERVADTPNGASVYVDYAHTPDALITALKAIRPHTVGRLVVVFGAGGDRDAGKRPLMGRAACDFADLVFVTDDNPRSEDPAEIRRQVLAGAPGASEFGDRKAAIAEAIAVLDRGDVLLVAGKGHETGQIIGDTILHFSDHEVIREVLGGGLAA